MALATTCPQCKTSFKVVPDQLKLRRGLVRCGVCQHVFSGVDYLRYVEDAIRPPAGAEPAANAPVGWASRPEAGGGATEPLKTAFFLPETQFAATTQIDDALGPSAPAPAFPPASIQVPEPTPEPSLGELPDVGETRVARPRDAGDEAIDLFGATGSRRGFEHRGRLWGGLAVGALSLLLVAQIALGARDWLATWVPGLRVALAPASQLLGLELGAPRELDALTIESFELQASGEPGVLAMTAVLRNRAAHEVRWPAMELTLLEGGDTPVVRRVLLPSDYAPGAATTPQWAARRPGDTLPGGVKARAEFPIKVALEVDRFEPTGYSVVLFYP